MERLLFNTRHLAKALSYFLGFVAIAAALAVLLFSKDPADLADWALNVLGVTFISLLCGLVYLSLFSLIRLGVASEEKRDYWLQLGVQAANGVTTLALTFTLLGISLGIGSLAGRELTPDTVQSVIRDVTANFSLAFMTTVIGLPISALLRSILLVIGTDRRSKQSQILPSEGGKNHEIFDI